MSEEPNDNLIEVSWHGKKIYLHKTKLDEWHSQKSDETRVDYINAHPELRDPVSVHRTSKQNRALQEPDDLVLVTWSGTKVRRRACAVFGTRTGVWLRLVLP
jgi:hypothetical protein